MKFSFKITSAILAAMMVGQGVMAIAQDVPQSQMSAAERAQNASQDKKLKALELLLQQSSAQSEVLKSFTNDLADAKRKVAEAHVVAAKYTITPSVESTWMTRGLGMYGGAIAPFLILRALPGVPRGMPYAKGLRWAETFAKGFQKPALVYIVLGVGIAVPMTLLYVRSKTNQNVAEARVEIAAADLAGVEYKIAQAQRQYNTVVSSIMTIAESMNSTITQHDRNITITGLNFPQLRNYTAGTNGVLQLQTFDEGNK